MQNTSIIVCYNPDLKHLLELCRTLLNDDTFVVLVDNSDVPYLQSDAFPEGCELITLDSNVGIAKAQNIGIQYAISSGSDNIIFFDQDSSVQPGLLRTMISALESGQYKIVAPKCIDDISMLELPSLRVNKYGISKSIYAGDSVLPIEVDIVISSGMAVSSRVFSEVGIFDESLFIDYVDTEWCLRCKLKQIPIYLIPSVTMYHRIGKKIVNLGLICIQIHSPERCYYQIRNSLHLFRKKHIPLLFAFKEFASTLINRIILIAIVNHKIRYAKMYLHAIIDGFRGAGGKIKT